MNNLYQVKLADGTAADATGTDPENAARRYVDRNRAATVIAVRDYPASVSVPALHNITHVED